MTWKVHWNDIIFVPNAKTRGSMFSLIANKMRGSQLVNEKCYAPLCDKTAAMKFKKKKMLSKHPPLSIDSTFANFLASVQFVFPSLFLFFLLLK